MQALPHGQPVLQLGAKLGVDGVGESTRHVFEHEMQAIPQTQPFVHPFEVGSGYPGSLFMSSLVSTTGC
jgi:hypothetical protein